MSTPTLSDFKKAMQALTTTVVKAEAAAPASEELAALAREGQAQLAQLLAIHAELASAADHAGSGRTHQGWFEQTVTRARAVFGISA